MFMHSFFTGHAAGESLQQTLKQHLRVSNGEVGVAQACQTDFCIFLNNPKSCALRKGAVEEVIGALLVRPLLAPCLQPECQKLENSTVQLVWTLFWHPIGSYVLPIHPVSVCNICGWSTRNQYLPAHLTNNQIVV